MQVLVVDDNAELAENLAEILSDAGHDVCVTHSATAALRQRGCFDFALLDVRMDGMDGVELLAALRHRCPKTVCVMMTAFSRDERLDAARRLGAQSVLHKPVQVAQLLELVKPAA